MQNRNRPKRYIFDASATAVAGQITHPFRDPILVQAGSTLPSIGGLGSSRVDAFRYKDVLSFESAYTQVIGSEVRPGIFETVSLCVVEKFNLLGVVTCDRIVGRVSSMHPGNPERPPESTIFPSGSRFEGLRIGNTFYETLNVAPAFFCRQDRASWSGLLEALGNEDERKLLERVTLKAPNGDDVPLPPPGEDADVLGFSIAVYDPEAAGQLSAPPLFEIPQFGTVHLGEFFCYPTARHLVMLRVEMGCPYQGDLSCGDLSVDGGPFPP